MTPLKNRPWGEGRAHAQKTSWLHGALAFLYAYGEWIALAALVAAVLVLEVLA